VSARNAGLEEQGEGVLVVGIRSEAARGGGFFFVLHFHFRTFSWLFDRWCSHGFCFVAVGYQEEGGGAEEWCVTIFFLSSFRLSVVFELSLVST